MPGRCPTSRSARAHWLERGLLAWDLPPEAAGWRFRLHVAPEGGLAIDDEAITGGPSYPLTLDPAGLPATLRASWPHLAAFDALRLSARDERDVEAMLTGQVAVAAYDDLGRLVDATSIQLPGVLDDVYGGAVDHELGVTWRGGRPTLAVWAPTAKDVAVVLRRPGRSADEQIAMRRDRDGVWSVRGDASVEGCDVPLRGRRVRAVHRRGGDEPRHRPVLAGVDSRLDPLGRRRPRRSVVGPVRVAVAGQAVARPAGGLDDLRAPRP